MIKKISSLIILIGSILSAQTTDLEKNKILNNPKSVEESNSKAIIKANFIEGYLQEYYTKTYYNTKGFLTKKEHYNDSGDLIFVDEYSYNNNNLIEKIESNDTNEQLLIIKDYEYFDNGFKELSSENDVIVKDITYQLGPNKEIISEKEINYANNNQMIERFNEFLNNNVIKTNVKYGKDGYNIQYKYDKANLPIEEVIYDLKNNLVSKKRRKFDEKKNIIEENLYDNTGKLKTNNRISYEYDEKGNWVKRTQYANSLEGPISNATRTIRY